MYHPWLELAIFAIKTVIILFAIAMLLLLFFSLLARGKIKPKNRISIDNINERYRELAKTLQQEVLSKRQLKQQKRTHKKTHSKKARKKTDKPRIFVLTFKGDSRANDVELLRQEITMLLTTARTKDEVVLQLESGGGMVHTYGLAASQLQRIRDRNIPLTIAVDRIAASGGYMMACVADKILAAPFAIIGSIGVLAQIPNFHRFLQKHHIDFEQLTAGKYKRTLSVFGNNTKAQREKMQQELEVVHQDFIDFIKEHRPQVDSEKIATGEYWLGQQAKPLQLVDELITSDDYLLQASEKADIFAITSHRKKRPLERFIGAAHGKWQQLTQGEHPIY